MKNKDVVRIMRDVSTHRGPESVGFVRWHYLPRGWAVTAAAADYQQTGQDVLTFPARIQKFLSGLTEQEFKNWLVVN